MNHIGSMQNSENAIRLLRSRSHYFRIATIVLYVQLVLSLLIPAIGSIISATYQPSLPYIAFISIIVTLIEAIFLDRFQKSYVTSASKVSEMFDCLVLDLKWDSFHVGQPIDAGVVHSSSEKFNDAVKINALRDWYPKGLDLIPPVVAALVCQISNVEYNTKLRRFFSVALAISAFIFSVALFAFALISGLTFSSFVLFLVPAVPFVTWSIREMFRQHDAVESLAGLRSQMDSAWAVAKDGSSEAVANLDLRGIQTAIYRNRVDHPLALPFLYWIRRQVLEGEMQVSASSRIEDYRKARGRFKPQ